MSEMREKAPGAGISQGEFEVFFSKVLSQQVLSPADFSNLISEHEADLLHVAFGCLGADSDPGG